MKVIKDISLEIPGTNVHYFNLDEYTEDNNATILAYGYNFLESHHMYDELKKYNRKVYLNVSMPTEFCGNVPTLQDQFFDEVYSICPYSVNWLNDITKTNKYKSISYPFNKHDIPTTHDKKYDVCYHGGLHGRYHLECLDIMRKFNYRYMSMTHGIGGLTSSNLGYATNLNLTNQEKLNLIAECKISICYNYFPVRDGFNDAANIKGRTDWFKNEAFKHIDDFKIIPQLKSRLNEAAMARTLNLVQKDPWNVVENYYVPDVDFVYFESNEELEEKIQQILNNWDDYQQMIESAYQKSLNYTTEKLYERIKTDIYEN